MPTRDELWKIEIYNFDCPYYGGGKICTNDLTKECNINNCPYVVR